MGANIVSEAAGGGSVTIEPWGYTLLKAAASATMSC